MANLKCAKWGEQPKTFEAEVGKTFGECLAEQGINMHGFGKIMVNGEEASLDDKVTGDSSVVLVKTNVSFGADDKVS